MPTKKTTSKKSKKSTSKKESLKFDAQDVESNKVIASLSYIFILCLLPLLLKRGSEFTQFHAKQGLTITVGWFVCWIFGIIPILGWLVAFLGNIALLVISIMGVIKTLDGKAWQIPYIYEWSKKFNL